MKVFRFSPGAFADLDDIYGFYERKETGLGEYFRSRINEDIEGLILTAGIHRKTFKDYHRLLSRVFPHAVYYTVTESEIIVWAVVDCRRHPDWITDRLSR